MTDYNITKLIPGVGTLEIKFGMSTYQVKKVAGIPDEECHFQNGNILFKNILTGQYLGFTFNYDLKLTWIEVTINKDMYIFDKNVFKRSIKDTFNLFNDYKIKVENVYKDDGSIWKSLYLLDDSLIIHYDNSGLTSSVFLQVPFDDNGQPIWPNNVRGHE